MKRLVMCLVPTALVLLPNPPKGPMKSCGSCGTSNEPWRTACIGCGASL